MASGTGGGAAAKPSSNREDGQKMRALEKKNREEEAKVCLSYSNIGTLCAFPLENNTFWLLQIHEHV